MLSINKKKLHILSGKSILIVLTGLELGGAERQGIHLARYLKNVGCDVQVMSTSDKKGLVVDFCEEAGIPWIIQRFHWPCRKSSLIRDTWRLIKALRKIRPDIVMSYCSSPNVGCGLTWKWSSAKACIWSQRGVNSLYGDSIEKMAYKRVSAVICNAAHEIEYLGKTLGQTQVPVSVVYNGVQLAPCKKKRSQWRHELGISKDSVVAVMVANFGTYKDHPTLLRAWSKCLNDSLSNQIRPFLLLAGFTHSIPCYETAQRLIKELGLQENVKILGQVRDISGLLDASDLGILISGRANINSDFESTQEFTAQEGLSNSVLEYMASGLPVIATDLPANHEALGDNQQQFCKPADSDDLALKLSELINNPALRKQLGSQNKQRAEQEFSIDKMCKKTIEIMENLLGNYYNNKKH